MSSTRRHATSSDPVGQDPQPEHGGIFATLSSFFAGAFTVTAIAVLTFYLTVEEKGIKKFFAFIIPGHHHAYVTDLLTRIQLRLGGWLRGYLSLGLVVAGMTYVGLLVIGIKYALVLALFAGVMEFVPLVGPIVSAIPALFFAFTQNPVLAIFVLVLYIAVQQVENHVLVPKIMQRSVGLSPVVVILVILVGAKLAGFIGLLLAVPLTIALAEFGRDVFEDGTFTRRFGRPS
ncbi:MAG: AI-2E family transporter [Candidatus Andersenbacteria bacterium]